MNINQFININNLLTFLIWVLIFSCIIVMLNAMSEKKISKKNQSLLIIFSFCSIFILLFNFYYISVDKDDNDYGLYTKEEMEVYSSYFLDYNTEYRDNLFLIEFPINLLTDKKGYILRFNIEDLTMNDVTIFENFCTYNNLSCQLDFENNKKNVILNKNKSINNYEEDDDFKVMKNFYKEKIIEIPYLEKDKNIYKKLKNMGFEIDNYGLEVILDKEVKIEKNRSSIELNILSIRIYRDNPLTKDEKENIYNSFHLLINKHQISIHVINEETKEVIDNFRLSEFSKNK